MFTLILEVEDIGDTITRAHRPSAIILYLAVPFHGEYPTAFIKLENLVLEDKAGIMSLQLQMKNNISRPTYENAESRFMSVASASASKHPTGQSLGVGLYWTLKGQDPEIAFMLVQYTGDFSEHYLAGPLVSHGFGVLGYATRYRAMPEGFILEKALDDIAAGTKWLAKNTSLKRLVFIGNSSGGSLMAAFQARAERDSLLRGADAFIFLNAHPGRAVSIYLTDLHLLVSREEIQNKRTKASDISLVQLL